jgi:hypothetical protein
MEIHAKGTEKDRHKYTNDRKVKINVKLSLCLIKYFSMKTYGGLEEYLRTFLTSTLDLIECSGSRPGRFTPAEKFPGTHW